MANSTTRLSSIVKFAKTHPEIAPVVQSPAGGSSLEPALTIASDVMTEMVSPKQNWKWNRFILPQFYTNSFQQDYALNVINLGWLEDSVIIDINNTSTPKPIWPVEVVKYLPRTSVQYGQVGQVCWLPNDQLVYDTWAASTTFTSPIGVTGTPGNTLTQIEDSNGNFWVVTTYGTTGTVEPTWPTTLVFPTQADPTATATTVTDGSVIWTSINPKGQGIRCNPLPPQNGIVYQFNLFGQYRPFAFSDGPFTSLDQTIEPIPDDFAHYFRAGFVAMAYRHSPDKGIRAKATDEYNLWVKALSDAIKQGDRERDNNGFYPNQGIMQSGGLQIFPGPAYPFSWGW